MKTKILTFLSLSALSLALCGVSGCGDRSTPVGTVEALLVSLQENNLAGFRDILSASAKERLGTEVSMADLKRTIERRLPSRDSAALRSTEIGRRSNGSVTVVNYRVVLANSRDGVIFNTRCRADERVQPAPGRGPDTGDRTSTTTVCSVSSWE